ncbi:MAG TPA: hypothetical protein PKY05_09970 [Fibrobacteria bacterium]|nr:hypothetical protein [Fibrobacteria bacterium]
MRKFLVLSSFALILGCGPVREFLRPITPRAFQDSLAPVVAPGFTLPAKAAKAQDSLQERLRWISRQEPPRDFTLERIAFEIGSDSSVVLSLTFQDGERLNSHGLTREQARGRMQERLRRAHPLMAQVREAGIRHPVLLKSRFRSKDFLFQNARWVDDSTQWLATDSLPSP